MSFLQGRLETIKVVYDYTPPPEPGDLFLEWLQMEEVGRISVRRSSVDLPPSCLSHTCCMVSYLWSMYGTYSMVSCSFPFRRVRSLSRRPCQSPRASPSTSQSHRHKKTTINKQPGAKKNVVIAMYYPTNNSQG